MPEGAGGLLRICRAKTTTVARRLSSKATRRLRARLRPSLRLIAKQKASPPEACSTYPAPTREQKPESPAGPAGPWERQGRGWRSAPLSDRRLENRAPVTGTGRAAASLSRIKASSDDDSLKSGRSIDRNRGGPRYSSSILSNSTKAPRRARGSGFPRQTLRASVSAAVIGSDLSSGL
jgi:hypothetical protein